MDDPNNLKNQNGPDLEHFITIPELAKKRILPLGETKLYELANLGKIPSYRIDKKIFVLESEVHEAIKNYHVRPKHGKAFFR